MKPETEKALHAALETPAFAGVRAVLEETAQRARFAAYMKDSIGVPRPEGHWRNDGWQAAWEKAMPRFGMGLGPINGSAWAAFTNENGPYFCCPPDFLTGDELAAALRDWALEEK